MISADQIKTLRERTGISIAQCKKALEEAGGDIDKALGALKAQGAAIADKKSDRELGAGVVRAYIHSTDNLGVLLEVHTETDFVAKNDELKALVDDIAMHIAASGPADIAELLEQDFIKDPGAKVNDIIKGAIQKFGERVEIIRFARFDSNS